MEVFHFLVMGHVALERPRTNHLQLNYPQVERVHNSPVTVKDIIAIPEEYIQINSLERH